MKAHHTKTPWKVSYSINDYYFIETDEEDNLTILRDEGLTEENAKFIVKTANNHAKLLRLVELLSGHCSYMRKGGEYNLHLVDERIKEAQELLTELNKKRRK